MAIDALLPYFLTSQALRQEKIEKRELTMLVGLSIMTRSGLRTSTKAVELYCAKNRHTWDYRTTEMLLKKLRDKQLVNKSCRNYTISSDGQLLLGRINRKVEALLSS